MQKQLTAPRSTLRLNVLHNSVGTVTGIWDLTSTLEEMRNLKYFLNHRCVHAPLSHVGLCLSLSILPLESVKVGDHFDMHLGYKLCTIFWKMKQTHKIAFLRCLHWEHCIYMNTVHFVHLENHCQIKLNKKKQRKGNYTC